MKSPRTYLLKRSSGLKQKNDYLQNQSMECYDAPLFNKIPDTQIYILQFKSYLFSCPLYYLFFNKERKNSFQRWVYSK